MLLLLSKTKNTAKKNLIKLFKLIEGKIYSALPLSKRSVFLFSYYISDLLTTSFQKDAAMAIYLSPQKLEEHCP